MEHGPRVSVPIEGSLGANQHTFSKKANELLRKFSFEKTKIKQSVLAAVD